MNLTYLQFDTIIKFSKPLFAREKNLIYLTENEIMQANEIIPSFPHYRRRRIKQVFLKATYPGE